MHSFARIISENKLSWNNKIKKENESKAILVMGRERP
jgi:hypothetical protein